MKATSLRRIFLRIPGWYALAAATLGSPTATSAQFDITQPGDPIVLVNGVDDGDGYAGPPAAGEGAEHAIDNVGQKYLNFLDLGSGFAVAPGHSLVTGLRVYTANDSPERDPASFLLEGSTQSLAGPWTTIASGPLALPIGRNPGGAAPLGTQFQEVTFANSVAYDAYRLTFPTIRDAALANSMQIGEVEFLGMPFRPIIVSHPTSQSASEGTTVTFNVVADGSPPLDYQWFFNQTNPMVGATNDTLVLSRARRADEGDYTVVISNGYGSVTSAPASLTVSRDHGQPAELGQTVHGYQDDFNGPTRNPDWVVLGPGGDHYVQTNGVLQVSVSSGDPNHLVYVPPGGYSTNVQEVLARVRVVAFGINADPHRAGIAVGVTTNTATAPSPWGKPGGLNLELRDYLRDDWENVSSSRPQFRRVKFLDDLRAWGPPGLQMTWMNNVWYWMRLRLAPMEDGVNSLFGKVWVANGQTLEPADWQIKWARSSPAAPLPNPVRFGYAGITGCSLNGLGQFEVDYILIKADGLPAITAEWEPVGPAPNPMAFTTLTRTNDKVYMEYFGGVLQSAATVTNAWADVTNATSPYAVTAAAGTKNFYRLREQEVEFTAWMTGDREVQPVSTAATGFGIFRVNGSTLNYDLSYAGMATDFPNAFLLGPADSTGSADVIMTLGDNLGTSGRLLGQRTLYDFDRRSLIAGLAYVNITTASKPDGEIRGQITPVVMRADLSGAGEVPPVTTSGWAQAAFWLIGNELSWTISYWGLSASATAASICGPAGNVLIPLSGFSDTAGTVSGSVTITDSASLGHLGDGMAYVNILTSAYPDGEIRGLIRR